MDQQFERTRYQMFVFIAQTQFIRSGGTVVVAILQKIQRRVSIDYIINQYKLILSRQIQVSFQVGFHPMMYQQSRLCDAYQWCNYDAVDSKSIIGEHVKFGLLIITGVILGFEFHKLMKIKRDRLKSKKYGEQIMRVFLTMIAWFGCTCAGIVGSFIAMMINIVVYYKIINVDESSLEPDSSSPIVIFSAIFQFLDELRAFLVVTLIIFIPYEWFVQIILKINDGQNSTELTMRERRAFVVLFKMMEVIRIYRMVRLIMIVVYFVGIFLIVFTKVGCQIDEYTLLFLVVEPFVFLGFFVLGYVVVKYIVKKQLITIEKLALKKIRFEFLLLFIANLCRVILNILFNSFLNRVIEYHPHKNCSDPNQNNWIPRTIFITFGGFIMHFLPIFTVIFIFRTNIREQQRNSHKNDIFLAESSNIQQPTSLINIRDESSATNEEETDVKYRK